MSMLNRFIPILKNVKLHLEIERDDIKFWNFSQFLSKPSEGIYCVHEYIFQFLLMENFM